MSRFGVGLSFASAGAPKLVPTLVSVAPTAFATTATAFTLTGTNLTGATALTYNGDTCTSIVVVNSTTITAVSPAESAGAHNLVVTTPGGSATLSVTAVAAPTLASVNYAVSDTAAGNTHLLITATGTNLAGGTAITLGGSNCGNITWASTTVSFSVPALSAGLHDLIVTTPSGSVTLSNAIEAWRPTTDGTNLNLWLRGDLGVTQSGGTCSNWADQSGNGHDFTAITTAKPTVNASGVNGLQTLDFDGTLNHLVGPAWSTLISASASTMCIAYTPNAYTTTNAATYNCDCVIGDANGYFGLYQKPSSTIMAYVYDSDDRHANVAGPAAASPAIVSHQHFGGNVIATANGGTPVSTAAGNPGSLAGFPFIGFGVAGCNMKFREIAVWNIDVGATILAKCQKYLNYQSRAY